MTDKNLTSLKVYSNDDPAGSTYKVSGGGTGGGLMLKVLYTDPSDENSLDENSTDDNSGYLAHMDGSDATWQEIYNAVMAGVYVSVIEEAASATVDTTALFVYTVERLTKLSGYAVVCSGEMTFRADTLTGRLTVDNH